MKDITTLELLQSMEAQLAYIKAIVDAQQRKDEVTPHELRTLAQQHDALQRVVDNLGYAGL